MDKEKLERTRNLLYKKTPQELKDPLRQLPRSDPGAFERYMRLMNRRYKVENHA
jgi:hypothetical protein